MAMERKTQPVIRTHDMIPQTLDVLRRGGFVVRSDIPVPSVLRREYFTFLMPLKEVAAKVELD